MSYSYTLAVKIPASPKVIYDTWLDSRGHSAMTGGKATQSAKIGADAIAWDGYITGKNLHLVPGKRIVQTWRTTQFTDADTDSIITVTLTKAPGGTWLTLNHANVPDDQTSYEATGWQTHYFEPMQRYFLTMSNVAAVIERTKKKVATKRRTTIAAAEKQPAKKKAGAKKTSAKKAGTKKSKKRSAKNSVKMPAKRKVSKTRSSARR